MKKKVVSVVLAAAMTTTLVAGCGSTGSADTAADTSAEAAEDTEATDTADTTKAATGDTIKVAVVKQMDHASLDEIANAVEEELDAIAAKNGVTIEYETYSGQGDQSVLNQIGTQVVSEDVDVIIPIATLAAQVMANCAEETQTPVVYAAISDPDAAELTGIDYVTGTSDALNTDFIMDMMFKQNPDVQKVGLLYSLSEANSTKPIVIRTDCASISVLKRITSGVKLMHVDSENGIKVANIAKVREQVRTDQEEQVESDEENPSDGM